MRDREESLRKEQAKKKKCTEDENRKRKRATNKEYTLVTVFFVLIFLSLIGYLIYFNTVKSEDFINSPYNSRQDTFSDRVIRGDITSSEGDILATTTVYEDGSEQRYYPYENMFAHVVGYDAHGKSGLESEANFQLLSSHSYFPEQIKNQLYGKKNRGDTVVSTLSTKLQSTAYYALGERRGAILVIEPSTGKIRAMVSKPDFNPNTMDAEWEWLINDENSSNLLNRVTNGAYPPGSTFKIVTALDYYREHGSMNGYTYVCQGSVTREDHTIHCYNDSVHGEEDMYTAFARSCNCSFADLGIDLGGASLQKTALSMLFNKKLPFQTYRKSTFDLGKSYGRPLLMQTAIGQGNTLVSPAHMALLTCAIANHGVIMEPSLIESIQSDSGETIKVMQPEEYKRILSEDEAAVLDEMMQGVVNNGTAAALSGRGYTAAGKTGSAEFDENGSSHSWFIGYSNVESPDLAVAIIVENGGTGSEAAVPIAASIFDAYYFS